MSDLILRYKVENVQEMEFGFKNDGFKVILDCLPRLEAKRTVFINTNVVSNE